MDGTVVGLGSLFASAFLSATLLPGGSEAVLVYLAGQNGGPSSNDSSYSALTLLAVASAGNTLGGMSSWVIGRLFPASKLQNPELHPAVARIRRYGSPILLLSWVPIVGDPLCVAAGWLRVSWYRALLFIAAGKIARYAVVLAVARQAAS
jgi:membrane protein YqaA with SNARE-associated domain